MFKISFLKYDDEICLFFYINDLKYQKIIRYTVIKTRSCYFQGLSLVF